MANSPITTTGEGTTIGDYARYIRQLVDKWEQDYIVENEKNPETWPMFTNEENWAEQFHYFLIGEGAIPG